MSSRLRISIVIISFTEKRLNNLRSLFESINIQSHSDLEVIVVVERNEIIYRFASDYSSRFPKSVILVKEKAGVSRARNIGIASSKGDVIAFVDDDAILAPDWSEELVQAFALHECAVGVTGRSLPRWTGTSCNFFPKSLYWMIGCTEWKDSDSEYYTNFATGVNMAFRKEAFATHKFELDIHYNASRTSVYKGLPNDENDFAVRLTTELGRPIIYNPKLTVLHQVAPERISISFVRKYAFWQGLAEARYNSRSSWRMVRSNSYKRLVHVLLADFFDARLGVRDFIKRLKFLAEALTFLGLGYAAYKNARILRALESRVR